jgi:hypothetical protein
MNHKFDRLLTISALTGWVASIAALLTIGVNSNRPLTPLAAPISPDVQRSFQAPQTHFPLKVAGLGLGNANLIQAPPFLAIDSQHWLDRRIPNANSLDLADPEGDTPTQPLWLNYVN